MTPQEKRRLGTARYTLRIEYQVGAHELRVDQYSDEIINAIPKLLADSNVKRFTVEPNE